MLGTHRGGWGRGRVGYARQSSLIPVISWGSPLAQGSKEHPERDVEADSKQWRLQGAEAVPQGPDLAVGLANDSTCTMCMTQRSC